MKKGIFLFVALVLPILIFLFLKQCGKNEFAIPVYHTSTDSLNNACGTHYKAPYTISDSVLTTVGWKRKSATLFVLESSDALKQEIARTRNQFEEGELQVVEMQSIVFDSTTVSTWRLCVLVARPGVNAVLMDSERRIRGYYALGPLKETDRLTVEIKILLKQY